MDMCTDVTPYNEELLQVEDTDDFCRVDFIEIVPVTRDTDGYCKTNDVKEEHLPVKESDDSCRLKITGIVSLARDSYGCSTTELVSGDWSAEAKQDFATVKQEPDHAPVCCVIFAKCSVYYSRMNLYRLLVTGLACLAIWAILMRTTGDIEFTDMV